MTQLHANTVGNTPRSGAAPAPARAGAQSPLRQMSYAAGSAALSPRPAADPLLRLGSSGAAVTRLQTLLTAHDASPGAIDGDFGPKTQRAVERFQRQQRLDVDGVVGPATWGALERSGGGGAPATGGGGAAQPVKASAGLVRLGCNGAQVELLQRKLEANGYDVGAVDGDFGPATLKAAKAFQRKRGLEDDGIVGKLTWQALGVAYDPSLTKLPSGGNRPSGGGQTHLPPGSSSGDPVALARSFCYQPPASSRDMRGIIPNFTAAGGATNNCVDFVSAILETCGRISGHHINVSAFEAELQAQGWHQVSMAKAQPGDVWINYSRGHTQLVATKGATRTIGSNNDRPGHQVINEKAGYDAVIYHRDFK
jgi:peptidoglycan hydrolase-like protein with peptidoglycan-binding domain